MVWNDPITLRRIFHIKKNNLTNGINIFINDIYKQVKTGHPYTTTGRNGSGLLLMLILVFLLQPDHGFA